ncbi:MAG: nucleotidyltransferase domain-containing protein [Puniceicoccales bacterium]|nr:nucleotidyltransferase domain-containing protein [Puniceicoccales bacterium]
MSVDLEKRHREHICAILDQCLSTQRGICVYAYGSRVKGSAHKFSDVDLAIESENPLEGHILAMLRNAFAESDLPYAVDVVDLAHVTPIFRANVDRCRELIFEV